MQWQTILLEQRNGVGLITLNRPQALNALNNQLIVEINQALDQLEKDPAIGCIVITGSEKAFAAGADIKEMADLTFPQIYLDDFFSLADRIAEIEASEQQLERQSRQLQGLTQDLLEAVDQVPQRPETS